MTVDHPVRATSSAITTTKIAPANAISMLCDFSFFHSSFELTILANPIQKRNITPIITNAFKIMDSEYAHKGRPQRRPRRCKIILWGLDPSLQAHLIMAIGMPPVFWHLIEHPRPTVFYLPRKGLIRIDSVRFVRFRDVRDVYRGDKYKQNSGGFLLL
jgi:hypothetical protein